CRNADALAIAAGARRALAPIAGRNVAARALRGPAGRQRLGSTAAAARATRPAAASLLCRNADALAIAAGARRALAPIADRNLAARALRRPAGRQRLGSTAAAARATRPAAASLLCRNADALAIAAGARRALAP